jgi:hypothetical protein
VGAMLAQNPIGKYDQPIVYASRLLNIANHNYTTIEKETLATIYALHKFRHFRLGNIYFLCRPMALVYFQLKQEDIAMKGNIDLQQAT